ncbi:MAG: lipopolysaccharide biosynthesis protein [Alphaproteobacteria bacterium]|nr:lipopolysaccharide biosynthesis protein [Alphaproteobacteria bacterium]
MAESETTQDPKPQAVSIQREILIGTAWVAAARWGIRGLGVISTIVLARLLVPADFGLVALATMVAGMISIFGEVGLLLHLIRERDPDRTHFDTVWTLRLLLGGGLGLVIFLAAPFAADWFGDPRLDPVLRVLALPPLLQGSQNTGIAWFRKNLDFARDFRFLVAQKIAAFAVTLSLAPVFWNYWALVAGIVAGNVMGLVMSFAMHPFRPRFDLSRTRAVWSFSTWTLAHHLVDFLSRQVDTLILGRYKTSTEVGLYTVAYDLAASPIIELALPASRVLFPAFAKIVDDRAEMTRVFARVVAGMAILGMALGPGVALVARDAVAVLLGAAWTAAVPLVEILAITGVIYALWQPIFPLLTALSRPKVSAYLTLAQVVLLVAAMLPAIHYYDLAAFAIARVLAMAAALVMTIAVFMRITGIALGTVTASLWRPTLAAIVMAGAVVATQRVMPDIAALRLVASIAIGGVAYVASLAGLWYLAGRPSTIEADLIAAAQAKLAQRRAG